ncbi:hypothetical protein MMC14_003624 [Varicellaria rhodocarpa]|nr:hypothetical protein [Varicellaria rhodocarpa]
MVATILTDFSYITPNNFIAVSVLFPLLDIIVVALRFYTRRVQKFSLKSDDWLTLAALVVNIGIGVTLIIEIKGNGISYLAAATPADSSSIESYLTFSSPEQTLNGKVCCLAIRRLDFASIVTHYIQIQFAVLQLQILLLLLLKLSAIMFYRRIFCPANRGWFHVI